MRESAPWERDASARSGRGLRGSQARRGGGGLVGLLVLAGLAGALGLAWMLALPGFAVSALQRSSGFGADVTALAADPFTGELRVEGLVLENPADWGERDFAAVRRLRVDGAAGELLRRGAGKLDRVEIELSHLTLVRDAAGRCNWDRFLAPWLASGAAPAAEGAASTPASATGSASAASGRRLRWRIREVQWRCDVLELIDYQAVQSVTGGPVRMRLEQPIRFTAHDVERGTDLFAAWDEALRFAGSDLSLLAWLGGPGDGTASAVRPAVEAPLVVPPQPAPR